MNTALVIEPNYELRENTAELLQLQGWNAVTANDKVSAIRAIIAHDPDVVLCDSISPKTESHDILSYIRFHAQDRHIPVIFLGQDNKADSKAQPLADAYLRKPFSAEELTSALDAVTSYVFH